MQGLSRSNGRSATPREGLPTAVAQRGFLSRLSPELIDELIQSSRPASYPPGFILETPTHAGLALIVSGALRYYLRSQWPSGHRWLPGSWKCDRFDTEGIDAGAPHPGHSGDDAVAPASRPRPVVDRAAARVHKSAARRSDPWPAALVSSSRGEHVHDRARARGAGHRRAGQRAGSSVRGHPPDGDSSVARGRDRFGPGSGGTRAP